MARKIFRQVKYDPKVTRQTIKKDLSAEGIDVSINTMSSVLHNAALTGCRSRRTALLKKNHRGARMKYAEEHVNILLLFGDSSFD